MSQKEQTPQRPGWYDDPDGVYEHQAYWDGIKWTGRTREPQAKVATAVATSIGILGGFAFYFGVMAADLKRVFDEFVSTRTKMEGKIGAAFATSADPTGGKETTIMSILQCLLIYGMAVVGDPMDASGHYGVACAGQPDEKTLDAGRKLGKRVAELVLKLA